MAEDIPVIDFGAGNIEISEDRLNESELKTAGKAIVQAFSAIGFCYLKNHGVPEDFLSWCRVASKEMFLLPTDFKGKYRRLRNKDDYLGWVGSEQESTNPKRPGDLKEAFNYSPNGSWDDWPDDVVPSFRRMCSEFFNISKTLALRVLKAIALGLELPPENDLVKNHTLVGQPGNHSEIRTLFYPPIPADLGVAAIDKKGHGVIQVWSNGLLVEIKKDQVRLGEHFDFGSLTVLFQDTVGGLEVCNRNGDWVPALPIAGTALLNIGEIMQKWTADQLIATKHRVMIPIQEKSILEQGRQSLVFFLCPDDEAIIKCLDGSDKYPPRDFIGHAVEMMAATYAGKY